MVTLFASVIAALYTVYKIATTTNSKILMDRVIMIEEDLADLKQYSNNRDIKIERMEAQYEYIKETLDDIKDTNRELLKYLQNK